MILTPLDGPGANARITAASGVRTSMIDIISNTDITEQVDSNDRERRLTHPITIHSVHGWTGAPAPRQEDT